MRSALLALCFGPLELAEAGWPSRMGGSAGCPSKETAPVDLAEATLVTEVLCVLPSKFDGAAKSSDKKPSLTCRLPLRDVGVDLLWDAKGLDAVSDAATSTAQLGKDGRRDGST
jgi:hypothetical protein